MKATYLFVLALLLPIISLAQYNLRPNAFHQDMLFYNPASRPDMADNDQRLILYSQTKVIPENDPIWDKGTSFFANYLKTNEETNIFFQVGYVHDSYSFFSRNTLYAGVGKEFSLGEHSSITFAGNAVLHSDLISWSDFQLPTTEDGNSLRISPDIDFGAQYQWKGFKLGASVRNIISLSQELDDAEIIRSQRAVVMHTSYDFTIMKHITLAPYFMLHTEMNTEIDAGLFLSLFDRVNASYLLRINELRSIFMLEVRAYKGLSLGGTYDTSPLFPDNHIDIFARYFF